MKFEYVIRKGHHYADGVLSRFLVNVMHPVRSRIRHKVIHVGLDPAFKDNLTPDQVPGQLNKVYGYALLGIPHWYSTRVTVRSCDGRVKWYWYEYVKGVRKERPVPLIVFEVDEGVYIFKFDLHMFRMRIPRYLRWLPMYRLHSYFGGKLPAPVDLKIIVEEF